MVDELVAAALGAGGRAAAVAAWARLENAAAAHRLSATADVLEAQLAAVGSAEREQWCVDNWDAVCAEVGAAQNVSLGVASHQLLVAQALRERLPRVGEVFAAGAVSLRVVNTIVYRTALITDRQIMAMIDAEIAAAVAGWGSLSVAKTEAAIDFWVQRYDPAALRRTEDAARGRHLDVHIDDGSGVAHVQGELLAHDGAALDLWLDTLAGAVCDRDPRTTDQRRSDAIAAFAHGGDRLACACGRDDCPAAETQPSAVVVHVIAEQQSLTGDAAVALDGASAPGPSSAELKAMTVTEALSPPAPPTRASDQRPGLILGGGLLPAPLLAHKLAGARIQPIVHPGDAPPEPRYIPSPVLAWFVRARDLTCRFPGCDQPAHRCDIDHTIPYPFGPTQASNLKCLCRKHHLLRTFWGWRDEQLPDGTVIWHSPRGQTYTTHPGSRILFPTLCRPTAPVSPGPIPATATTNRGLMMPRRNQTRAQHRAARINTERHKPPPR